MNRLRKFVSLNAKEKALFFEACVILTSSSIGVSIFSFKAIERLMHSRWYIRRRANNRHSDDYAKQIDLVKSAISRATNSLPWQTWCLSRSVTAFLMLRRRHVPTIMFTGVKFDGSCFLAHAWVQAGHNAAGPTHEQTVFTPLIRIESPAQLTGESPRNDTDVAQ